MMCTAASRKSQSAILIALTLTALAHPAAAGAQSRPYDLEMVKTLVRGGVAQPRFQQLIGRGCVDFAVDPTAEAALRMAGATDWQVAFLRGACRSYPGPRIPLAQGTLSYEPSRLRTLTLSYSLRALRVLNYTANQQLVFTTGEDGRDVVTLTTRQSGPGLDVEITSVAEARTLAPISYTYTKHDRAGTTMLQLEREEGRVVGTLSRPRAGKMRIDAPFEANTVLPTMEDLVLQASALELGQVMTFSSFDYRTGIACTLITLVESEQRLRTPAGEFDTWFLRSRGCGGEFRLYMRKEAPHFMVRQEGSGVTVELREVSF